MIIKKFTDVNGRWQYRVVRQESDSPQSGIPLGIPDLSELPAPEKLITELHNEFTELGLITWQDVQHQQNAITRVVRRVSARYGIDDQKAAVIRRAVIELYRARR